MKIFVGPLHSWKNHS